MLLEHNSNVNIQDNAWCTPLQECAFEGYENVCRFLLEHNADVIIQGKDCSTPLHLSARRNRDCSKIIDLLVKYGVQNVSIRDAKGRTPLQMAVIFWSAQAVKTLVDLGADISVVKADEKDAIILERLKNEAERMEQYLKFEMGTAQKANETENAPGVTFVPGKEKLTKSHLKSKKKLRQSPSSTARK